MRTSDDFLLGVEFAHALDMRYARQGFELTVEIPQHPSDEGILRDAFLDTYARQYGHADAGGDIEIVNLRTTVIGVTPKPQVRRLPRDGGDVSAAALDSRPLSVAGQWLTVPIYERERLPVDAKFVGPTIIEESGSTTVVLSGWHGHRDEMGNLVLEATS